MFEVGKRILGVTKDVRSHKAVGTVHHQGGEVSEKTFEVLCFVVVPAVSPD